MVRRTLAATLALICLTAMTAEGLAAGPDDASPKPKRLLLIGQGP
jgi:hypothetical protein